MSQDQLKKQQGLATALVLIVLFLLTVVAFALTGRGIQNMAESLQSRQNIAALYAAQAGTARALYGIQQNDSSYPSNCGQTATPASLSNQFLPDNASFAVSITNNFGALCTSNVTAADGTQVPPGMEYLTSVGTMRKQSKAVNVMLQVTRGWNYPDGLFGNIGVTLNGNAISDSYNSCNGLYGGSNVLQNGNVATNSASSGSITLTGNANIQGQATVGPGGTPGPPTISTSVHAQYSSAGVLPSQLSLPPVTDPLGGYGTQNITINGNQNGGTLQPGEYGDISVSGNGVLTLTCGTYSISSIQVSGNGQVIINQSCAQSNPVEVYVYNTLQLSGNGIANNDQNSTRLVIYGMSSLTSAQVSGNGVAAYALYAPSAAIQVTGNGNIYGSLVGASITNSGNANIHYDECLATDPYIGQTNVVRKMWSSK